MAAVALVEVLTEVRGHGLDRDMPTGGTRQGGRRHERHAGILPGYSLRITSPGRGGAFKKHRGRQGSPPGFQPRPRNCEGGLKLCAEAL
jgi:hypothetical protein